MFDLRKFLNKHGIKQTYFAKEVGISDTLLRYRMDNGMAEKNEYKCQELLRRHALRIIADIDRVRAAPKKN